jgi:23S rRNA (cytosine1962-C5)-methyltransferase
MENNIKIFLSEGWSFGKAQDKPGYELLDTGEGEKLERFDEYTFVRPLEDAFWKKTLSKKEWESADGKFLNSKSGEKAGWRFRNKEMKESWVMSCKDIRWTAKPTPFRHLSFFPEQQVHWDFIYKKISEAKKPVKFLNLFGYTGVASLFALKAGAEVTHMDASKQSLALAQENQKLSGLQDKPMRIIPDDVLKFLERETKRGVKYDAVIMDPPKFGRGPKGETWKIEEDLPKLLTSVKKVLSPNPLFVILTSYAIDSSSLSLGHALSETMKDLGGEVTTGEMCILEKSNGRAIPLANTAVWQAK